MTAALSLAEQGFETHLVERSAEFGGNARQLTATWQGDSIPAWVKALAEKVQGHPKVTVHLQTTLKHLNGFVGNLVSTLGNERGDLVLEHGALILATGGREYQPREYGYGEDDRILTHLEMDQALLKEEPRVRNASGVVFIQCVGSREPERPYCSRVCCTHTLKAAIDLKEKNPDRECAILYRDIRSYGTRETLYQKARDLGVLFIRFNREDKPRVEKTPAGGLQVLFRDHILGRDVALDTDLVCLAAAILRQDNQEMAQLCKVPVNEDGFFMEAHAKLRPVDLPWTGFSWPAWPITPSRSKRASPSPGGGLPGRGGPVPGVYRG